MQAQIQAFVASLESQPAYSLSTRLAYHRDLRHFQEYLQAELQRFPQVSDLTAASLLGFLQNCQREGWSKATVLRRRAALRLFCKHLLNQGLLQADPFLDPVLLAYQAQVEPAPGQRPNVLTDEQINMLMATLDAPQPLLSRDCAIFTLLLEIGMSASQIVALNIEDFDTQNNCLRLRDPRKEKEDVWVPLTKSLEPLSTYVRIGRVELGPGPQEKALFISQVGTRMSRQGIWQMLRQLGEKAGLSVTLSPRLLRYTAISRLSSKGVSLGQLQVLLGHSNPLSTQALLRRMRAPIDEQVAQGQ